MFVPISGRVAKWGAGIACGRPKHQHGVDVCVVKEPLGHEDMRSTVTYPEVKR